MTSAKEYLVRIRDLGLDLRIEVSTEAAAKSALKHCRSLQKKLRLIKKEVNLEMKVIRADYRS